MALDWKSAQENEKLFNEDIILLAEGISFMEPYKKIIRGVTSLKRLLLGEK